MLEDLIQIDIGKRGLKTNPKRNLCSETKGHLGTASRLIAQKKNAVIGIVTGFYIPRADPPAIETDGPPGAMALARLFIDLGYHVIFFVDPLSKQAIVHGVNAFMKKSDQVDVCLIDFPLNRNPMKFHQNDTRLLRKSANYTLFEILNTLDFLISIERVGPVHTSTSAIQSSSDLHDSSTIHDMFRKYGPKADDGCCYNMLGESIDEYEFGLHYLFETVARHQKNIVTIGIGDGGNEIGMGTVPWVVIHENICSGIGGKIACRLKTDFNIVAAVSNWGAYALAASLALHIKSPASFLTTITKESEEMYLHSLILNRLAVDGVLAYPRMSVDGLEWSVHASVIGLIQKIVSSFSHTD